MNKQLMKPVAVLLALSSLFSSCDEGAEGPVVATGDRLADATNCYPAVADGAQFDGLNAMLVYYLAKNYKDQQLTAINNNLNVGQSDARSVWFDLETLKRFIHEIETQTCGKCDNNSSQRLGVRIYYGAYPTDTTTWTDSLWATALAGVPASYAGKHTVMMVPTYHNEANNTEVDFDPRYVTSGCNFTNIESFYNNMKENPPVNITLTVLSGMATTAQNHGQLIPPPYDVMGIVDEGAGIMYAVDTNP